MMRFSRMAGETWRGPGAAWWQGFEAATEPYLQAAAPKELLRLGKMLSTQQQQQPVGAAWVAAFLQATRKRCLHPAAGSQRLSARHLANLGKAVAGLGAVPDRGWLQAWELSLELQGCGVTLQVARNLHQTRAAWRQLARSSAAASEQ